jgi:glyoxylase-like metal-dependent hydrolase (beta-lactamase superfamily II)
MRALTIPLTLFIYEVVLAADDSPFVFGFDEISPGVWAGVREQSSRYPVMGNTTFVISDAGVVVFDGGGIPVMAEQIIAKVKSETQLPVTHVVISHWHGDHHFGIHRFAEEYPNVQFIAHSFTQAAMNGSLMDYIDKYPTMVGQGLPSLSQRLKTGLHPDGNPLSAVDRKLYESMIADADVVNAENQRVRVTQPSLSFDDQLVIHSGSVRIELMKLGHGNTEGDIVMWLPQTRVVAVGDLVVHPSPYAFNVPPRPWAHTLSKLNKLDYDILVPGHGMIQKDSAYVDLIIEAAESIADQRDQMLAAGLSAENVEQQLDFSAFELRFTGGDPDLKRFYTSWFEKPFRKAALKALAGEPMVKIGPRAERKADEQK